MVRIREVDGIQAQTSFSLHHQEEAEARQRRLEEVELGDCTFTPNTKWQLAAERRKKAKEEQLRIEEELLKSRQSKLSVSS